MSRIPYFEVWDRKHKCMADVWAIHWKAWDNFPEQINFIEVWSGEEGGGTYELTEGEFDFLQWTGRLDIKNKPIYEGHVIKQHWSGGEKSIGKVVYNEEEAMFLINYPNGGGSIMNHSTLKNEIIGNIYENPELMEES